jgi:hypothetical protein
MPATCRHRLLAHATGGLAIVVLGLACLSALGGWSCSKSSLTPESQDAQVIGAFANSKIRESSGVVASLTQPGIYWTLNDSGNDPSLFAFDSTGKDLGEFPIVDATNVDWEALGTGSCPEGTCLYIADVGDNEEKRTRLTIYRVVEPSLAAARPSNRISVAATLTFSYEDGPHDTEAMWISRDTAVNLITKGRSNGVWHFRIPPNAWGTQSVVAQKVDSLPRDGSAQAGLLVTDAGTTKDKRFVAIRTYWHLYVYQADTITGRLSLTKPHTACRLFILDEEQGEAVTGADNSGAFLVTSEGVNGQISLVRCHLPQ